MNKHRTGSSSSYPGTVDAHMDVVEDAETIIRPGLVLLYAPNFEQLSPAYVFASPSLVIGRDASNAVSVPEQAVSRQHARIHYNGERWILSDLGSRNGTMVDGTFLTQPVELEHLHEVRVGDAIFKFVEGLAEHYVRYRLDGVVSGEPRSKVAKKGLIGGYQMDHIASELERIAPTQLSCVLLGETGTGKEVAARAVHEASQRRGSFQAINCAAIPHNLLESELFGYRRGAFSGADRDKPGLIRLADGGTLFLDEIGDMPLEAQAKLLRVLQTREVFPLGGTTPEPVDLRVVCATHRDLQRFVRDERFRGDLFARLSEHVVKLPPLRERKEDIYQLTRAFMARYQKPHIAISYSFLVALLHYDWPFNVRELESCIKRAVALSDGNVLDTGHLPDPISETMKGYAQKARTQSPSVLPSPPADRDPPKRGTPTEAELRALLAAHAGNIAAVGRELGKERMQVHRWMKRYGISIDEYRGQSSS